MADYLSYKNISHPSYNDTIKAHNSTTLKLVKTGEYNLCYFICYVVIPVFNTKPQPIKVVFMLVDQ